MVLSDWCAKLYQHAYYGGWEHKVEETNGKRVGIHASKNDEVSSVKVKTGCKFTAYKDYYGNASFTINEDMDWFREANDQLSSYSCICGEYY